jgi:phosphohistidine swiveling domain-containing protein
LEALGKRKGMESGDVYYVYPRELPLLVSDARSMLHIIRARKQAFKNYEKLKMPHVIRESDIDTLGILNETDEEFTQAMGNFLAEGPLIDRGTIINVDEFQTLSEVNDAMKKHKDLGIPVILVGSQMNLNHDYLIAQASGVVIENAGIVAHGAQRARDLGKGAIGGIKSNQLKTGMNVLFDPTNKIVRKLE